MKRRALKRYLKRMAKAHDALRKIGAGAKAARVKRVADMTKELMEAT